MSLGARIREIRKDNAITQSDFAERMLVSASYISKVESGKEQPSDIFLKLMSLEFNISLDWLKTGEGKKKITDTRYDYFERNQNYNFEVAKELVNFQKIIQTLPKGIDASIYFMLGEYTHLLKSEYLTESQKTVLASIIANIFINITEVIDKFFALGKNDRDELLRFEQFYKEAYTDFANNLNDIKKVLIPTNL